MLKLAVIFLFWLLILMPSEAAVPEGNKMAPAARKPEKKVTGTKASPSVPVVLPELSPEQILVSEKVVLGAVPCELGAKVVVKQDRSPGRFILELGRQSFRMEPALTTTGAVRLEDASNGVVWLQLGNKSMLLNHRLGKRLADACVNLHQSAVATAMEKNKSPGLLEDEAPPTSSSPQLPPR